MNKMPEKILDFSQSGVSISDLVNTRHGYGASDYPWAKKMLGKFPLPSWQRDSVWTKKQKISLIESVYLGYDLGSVVINGYLDGKNDTLVKFSDCLIDGQQRIEAMIEYTHSKFPVFGAYWKDLNRHDQSRFLYRELSKRMVHCFEEEKLKEVYNHLNFSGTNHKKRERA